MESLESEPTIDSCLRNDSDSTAGLFPRIALFAAIIIVTILHLPLAEFPVGRDQGVWATAGYAINNGLIFFKDYLHFNLPGLGFSYALAFNFTDDPRSAGMLVNLIGSLLTIAGMYLLLQQTGNRKAAGWAVILYAILWPTFIVPLNLAQKDFMGMYGVLLGTWLMARANSRKNWRKLSVYASGIAIALAIMYKPLFAFTGILLLALHAYSLLFGSEDKRKQWKKNLFWETTIFVAGGLTVAIPFLLYLIKGEAMDGLYHGLFVFAPAYAGLNRTPLMTMLSILFKNTAFIAPPFDWSAVIHYVIWTPMVIHGLLMLARDSLTIKKYWLYVPFLTALFTYLIQGKAFDYHAMPWQISLFLAAGYFLEVAGNSSFYQRERKTALLLIVLCLGSLAGRALLITHYAQAEIPAWLEQISREEYLKNSFPEIGPSIGVPSPSTSEQLANWLQTNSNPKDKILVWGLECQIYVLARRMFATNCPFDFLLTANLKDNPKALSWQQKIRQQFMKKLEIDRPKFILIVNGDISPVEPISSNEVIGLVSGFQEHIDAHYHKVKTVQMFEVYELNQ